MARQKLSTREIPIARRDEAIGRGPGPWKAAPDPKNGVGGMAKPCKFLHWAVTLQPPAYNFQPATVTLQLTHVELQPLQ